MEVFTFNVLLNICTFRETLFSPLGRNYFEKARSPLRGAPVLEKIDELETRWKQAAKAVCACVAGVQDLSRCKIALWFSPRDVCSEVCDLGAV